MGNVYGPAWMSHYDVRRMLVLGGVVLEVDMDWEQEQFGRELWLACWMVAVYILKDTEENWRY